MTATNPPTDRSTHRRKARAVAHQMADQVRDVYTADLFAVGMGNKIVRYLATLPLDQVPDAILGLAEGLAGMLVDGLAKGGSAGIVHDRCGEDILDGCKCPRRP